MARERTPEEKADLKRRARNVIRHSLGLSVFIKTPNGEIVEAVQLQGDDASYCTTFVEPDWDKEEQEDDRGP